METALHNLFDDSFLDYASYTLLDRAIPDLRDGLKPVQRRILHSLYENEDGRYNKVANIVGHTMRYHPHGDASIYEALVQLGQKGYLVDMQGNWGNVITGDSAAAARYIESRLSPLARESVFDPAITTWQASYDSRSKEPVILPVLFPLLLTQGADGIAVGFLCKILPHNLNEVLDAAIAHLEGKQFALYPDFQQGGVVDITDYQDGARGGKIRVRAQIDIVNKGTLSIKAVPYTTTTASVLESIVAANEKGKIRISKVVDNSTATAEIVVTLPSDVDAETARNGLFHFTDCQVSISPSTVVIKDNKPTFLTISEVLAATVQEIKNSIHAKLRWALYEDLEKKTKLVLERLFIHYKVYRDLENALKEADLLQILKKGLSPYIPKLHRELVDEDYLRLLTIPVRRIARYDLLSTDKQLEALEDSIRAINTKIANLTQTTIQHFRSLKAKFGSQYPRRTSIHNGSFERIQAAVIAVADRKLYVDKTNGFIGTNLKDAEDVGLCSQHDDVLVVKSDGNLQFVRVADKVFVGKTVLHCQIVDPNAYKEQEFLLVYQTPEGISYVKKFTLNGFTRQKDYLLTSSPEDKVLLFSAQAADMSKTLVWYAIPDKGVRKVTGDFNLAALTAKGRDSQGNILQRKPLRLVKLTNQAAS